MRRKAAQSNAPPTSVAATAAMDNGPVPPRVSLVDSSPPAGTPPAKRPRTRAAARAGGQPDPPTPEKSRIAGVEFPCVLNLSVGAELCSDRDVPPVSPPPASPTTPLDAKDTLEAGHSDASLADAVDTTQHLSSSSLVESDYNEELWENGIWLNTRRPPWQSVFPPRGPKYCRFCTGEPMPNQDKDDNDFVCADCNELSTFQLVVKHAPRWRYHNRNSIFADFWCKP